jgi:hypothetical protein
MAVRAQNLTFFDFQYHFCPRTSLLKSLRYSKRLLLWVDVIEFKHPDIVFPTDDTCFVRQIDKHIRTEFEPYPLTTPVRPNEVMFFIFFVM